MRIDPIDAGDVRGTLRRLTRFARRYRRIARSLSRVELTRSSMDETFALTDQDLLDKEAGRRFLDFYGDEGVRTALERYGLLEAIRKRGWDDFALETSAYDDRHTLFIDGHTKDGARERLVELLVRRDRLQIEPLDGHPPERTFDVLTVDWITLQDPNASFTEERLRLPGQNAPGLGIGEPVMELLYRVVERLGLDALVTVAEYFHNAVLYARELPFVDPWHQGQLHAIAALLFDREKLSFAQAAWAMHWGYVIDVDDSVVRWSGEAMMHTKHPELRGYLECEGYLHAVERAKNDLRYHLHRTAFDEAWEQNHDALLRPPPQDDSQEPVC